MLQAREVHLVPRLRYKRRRDIIQKSIGFQCVPQGGFGAQVYAFLKMASPLYLWGDYVQITCI